MPIYEYACACGKTFEALIIRTTDEQDVHCPECQGTQVQRVMSQTVKLHPGLIDYQRPDRKKVR